MEWNDIYARLVRDREDRLAWAALAERIRRWAHAQLRGQTWHVVEDVVADTCSSVAVSLERAHGHQTFAGFVYGFYLNERRRALVGKRKTVLTQFSATNADVPVEPRHEDFGIEDWPGMLEALAGLPPRERVAVSLRHLDGVSAAQIGEQLGVSSGSARQLVHRGLLRLRRQLPATKLPCNSGRPG